MVKDFEFSKKIALNEEELPPVVFQMEDELKFADGSVMFCYDDYYEHWLTNGVVRLYSQDYDKTYHLRYEMLPDGRAKGYTEDGDLFYERDENGNYHLDKQETDDEYRTIEDGTKEGWIKQQFYEGDELTEERENKEKTVSATEFYAKSVFEENDFSHTIYTVYHDGKKEEKLADGSVMIELDDEYYEHRLTNGVVRIIREDRYGEEYSLVYEALPNGKARAYDEDGEVIYECDEKGTYHLDKPETDDEYRMVEEGTKFGWTKRQIYNDDEPEEEVSDVRVNGSGPVFSDKLQFNKEELPAEIYDIAHERKLADGSIIIYREDYYEHRLANGGVRIYDEDYDGYRLVYEKLPTGQARVYDDEGHVIYECDAHGKYHLDIPEDNYDPRIVEDGTRDGWMKRQTYEDDELLEEKTNDLSSVAGFSKKLQFDKESLPTVILEIDGEKWYADGSVERDGYYQQKLSDGTVRIYEEDYYEGYHLVYEKLPKGQMRVYDTEGTVLFEKDEFGHYKLDTPESYDSPRVVEEGTADGWLKRAVYEDGIITISDNNEEEHYIKKDADGHILEEGNKYAYKKYFKSGKVCEEKTSSGDVYCFNENGDKVSEDLADGTKRKWTDDGSVLILEELSSGEKRAWTAKGQMILEHINDEDHREWYANGRKKVEKGPKGKEKRWHENPYVLAYEKDGSGRYKKYDKESRVIEEFDGSHKVKYAYHGHSRIYSHVHHYDLGKNGRFREDMDKYMHFQENGVEDTEKYLAIKIAAAQRVSDDNMPRENRRVKRVITKISRASKISKIKKSIAMYRAAKQLKKGREAAKSAWPVLSDER